MPIRYTIDHKSRTVEATWSGQVSAEDWAKFIEDMRAEGLASYAKLHDLSQASVDVSAAQIRDLARQVNAVADDQPLGPAAFIIDSARALELVMLFEDGTASSIRPIAIFPSRELAAEWLDGVKLRS